MPSSWLPSQSRRRQNSRSDRLSPPGRETPRGNGASRHRTACSDALLAVPDLPCLLKDGLRHSLPQRRPHPAHLYAGPLFHYDGNRLCKDCSIPWRWLADAWCIPSGAVPAGASSPSSGLTMTKKHPARIGSLFLGSCFVLQSTCYAAAEEGIRQRRQIEGQGPRERQSMLPVCGTPLPSPAPWQNSRAAP